MHRDSRRALPRQRSAVEAAANPWLRPQPGQPGPATGAPLGAVLPMLGGTTLALGLAGLLTGALLLG